jgi:hypothetical protein
MDFGAALDVLKNGGKVSRKGWNGWGTWLELQTPDDHSKMTVRYIYLTYPGDANNCPGLRGPWYPAQTDMLAEDWFIFHKDV